MSEKRMVYAEDVIQRICSMAPKFWAVNTTRILRMK